MGSAAVQRIHDVHLVKLHQFREDASPKRHAVQPDSYLTIDNFYNITVYNKGAELIRMLYLLLGPKQYRAATDLYFERYDGCAVTIEEFIQSMEEASGRNLQQFRRWLLRCWYTESSCASKLQLEKFVLSIDTGTNSTRFDIRSARYADAHSNPVVFAERERSAKMPVSERRYNR